MMSRMQNQHKFCPACPCEREHAGAQAYIHTPLHTMSCWGAWHSICTYHCKISNAQGGGTYIDLMQTAPMRNNHSVCNTRGDCVCVRLGRCECV